MKLPLPLYLIILVIESYIDAILKLVKRNGKRLLLISGFDIGEHLDAVSKKPCSTLNFRAELKRLQIVSCCR